MNNQGVPILNPVAQFLIANPTLYPLPNATPSDGIAANNYQAHTRNFKANNQGDIKIDYSMSSRDKLSGFYAMSTAYDGTTPVLPISFNGPNLYPTKLTGANWVHTFSPSLVNSARIGFTRTVWATNFSVDSTGQFGDTGNSKVGITFPNQTLPGYTYQSISGGIFAGGNPVQGGGLIDNTYSYIDSLSWQKSRHYFTFGTSWLRYQNNYPTANNSGLSWFAELQRQLYDELRHADWRLRRGGLPAWPRQRCLCHARQRECGPEAVARGHLL